MGLSRVVSAFVVLVCLSSAAYGYGFGAMLKRAGRNAKAKLSGNQTKTTEDMKKSDCQKEEAKDTGKAENKTDGKASSGAVSNDEIFRAYIDVLTTKLAALELFSEALGQKDAMAERLAIVRTVLTGGLKDKNGEFDEEELKKGMAVGKEVTEELVKIIEEGKELDEEAKKTFKVGLLKSRESIAKEWLINIRIAKTWLEIVLGVSKSAKSGNKIGLATGIIKGVGEAKRLKARKPLFRELRKYSKENRKLHNQFVYYAVEAKLVVKEDATDELPDMPECEDLDEPDEKEGKD